MMCLKTPSEISTILASVEVLQSLVSSKTVTPNCNQHGPLGLRELEAIILFLTSICSWLVFFFLRLWSKVIAFKRKIQSKEQGFSSWTGET